MRDVPSGEHDTSSLLAENARLRAKVQRLEQEVVELDLLAHLDPLVPLANRRGMIRELEILIARFNRYGDPAAMLFVDLDALKMLNDSFGHAAGDAALVHVADLLNQSVRTNDTAARLGGDEFGILLDHADEESAFETAERLANRIAEDDFLFEGVALPLSVAIGVSMIAKDDTPTAVLARADKAMYGKKASYQARR